MLIKAKKFPFIIKPSVPHITKDIFIDEKNLDNYLCDWNDIPNSSYDILHIIEGIKRMKTILMKRMVI